jgi:dTMP kinase
MAAGAVVVCDRFLDSSIAYQGVGRDLGIDRVRDLSLWATGGLVPDLTVVLDIDPVIGLARLTNPDRLEAEPLAYHQRVREAFLQLAAAEPHRYVVLDASDRPEAIALAIANRVDLALRDGRP